MLHIRKSQTMPLDLDSDLHAAQNVQWGVLVSLVPAPGNTYVINRPNNSIYR